ncbi:hypothetical protein AAGV33_07375 [Flavobacterium sp. FBOR7N2.3]|uniref:DUF4238 domain-containing protein n=1 Tax=Flavobacterium magnesitis TaxID=3138077 RepID=A0ABV4TM13_9FLAO
MKYIFDVDKIVKYLEKFKDNLGNLYTWKVHIEKLVELTVLKSEEIDSINKLNPYEKEIILKNKVNLKLHEFHKHDKDNFEKLCLWIIKDWGGILTAKDSNSINLISEFLNSENPSYKRIASSSKVGAYMYPEKYIIYDSRVAYSLNWIILSQNAGNVYFPIPDGRNSKMSAFDMNVIIRMNNITRYVPTDLKELTKRKYINERDKSLYIPEKEAYMELNKLIKKINNQLWESDKFDKLFYTEMLLFSIADREIFKDITERIGLTIN